MSNIVKATVIWQKLPVDTYTNLETGEILVYQKGSILLPGSGPGGPLSSGLLAYSTPGNGQTKWQYNNQAFFRNLYNNAQRDNNKPVLTEKQFNQRFFTQGTTAINGIRAKILTDEDSRNYANANISVIDTEQLKKNHFANGVPGVIEPGTGRKVNFDGTKTDSSVTDQQIVVVDSPNPDATPDPDAPAAPVLPGPDAPANIGTDVDGDGVISQGPNPSYESVRKDRGGTRKILKYPYHAPPAGFEYDYISITAYDYEPSGLDFNPDINKNLAKGRQYETVFFPMQPQLSETNAVSWSDDQLNPIQAALGSFAADTITGIGGMNAAQLKSAVEGLFTKAKDAMNDANLGKFITAYFAGQAVGANVMGRETGMVINPNLELLFNGPNLRTFQFNFRLTPRSQVESEEIRRIIRAFKRNMAVSKTSSSLFLTSPRIFQLKYIYKGGGDHPYLNKFKPCALSNFQVNYTPDGSYATFDSTGSLTAYDLTMSFSEVMPIYAEDIPGNTESTMGY